MPCVQDGELSERRGGAFSLYDVTREGDHLVYARGQVFENVSRSPLLLIAQAFERKTPFGMRAVRTPLIAVVVDSVDERRVCGELDEARLHARLLARTLQSNDNAGPNIRWFSRFGLRVVLETAMFGQSAW